VITLLRLGLVASALLVAGAAGGAAEKETKQETKREPTLHDKVYRFEHRLLGQWVHGSKGAFFAELLTGDSKVMRGAATRIVGEEFAQKIAVRALPEKERVLITFAPPAEAPECFCALVVKVGEGYRYLTLEKTRDLLNNGFRSVVGEWIAEGTHRNFGPRKYSDAEQFLAEMDAKLP
jgi:hypothetical protein